VLTNGTLTKAQTARVADMTHDGLARAIEPVHTGFDGDTVFALSTGRVPASVDFIGVLAALVMEAAIHDAVLSATAAYGLPSAREMTADLNTTNLSTANTSTTSPNATSPSVTEA
jgi:L-aminopeptidase/D-esterase-like protein